MKGFTIGFLVAIYSLPSFAASGFSRAIPSSDSTVTTKNESAASRVTETSTDTKTSGSRMAVNRGAVTTSNDMPAISRSITRSIDVDALATQKSTRGSTNQNVIARSSMISVDASSDARAKLNAAVNTVGRSARTDSASINANPAVRRLGITLRPSTAEVGGRAIIGDTGVQTGSNIKNEISNMQSQSRIASIKTRDDTKLDAAAIAEAKDQLEQKAALNKSCQEQYNDCMDQFCSVVDNNQKRCSCSSNLAKYAKVEQAVKDANAQLNEVAQNIRYVGLSADEISAIMSATEAEEALSGVVDTTESRSMLAEIEKMIKDPTTYSSSSSYSTDSYGLLDINLDFSSDTTSDLFSLDFLTDTNNGFSSLRGKDLYNAAKKRCATVISQCRDVGATSDQITGNYDLAIDKDCIAYEQGLSKMNDTLIANVRSAKLMLQKARLAVLQNQNTYGPRECIGALENCMLDDMVCGENYTKCLDPTKQFIDENGNVVLGQNINYIQKFMTNYNNASVDETFLKDVNNGIITINKEICASDGKDNGSCIVKYLLTKIGTGKKVTDGGLCRPVLDKCRAYTYKDGEYDPFNDIVKNYIQRAMVNIKSAQYQIVADYASTCLNDIAACYNQQVSQVTSWAATASASSVYNIMRGACRNVALTCGYAVFSANTTSSGCPGDNVANAQNTCIENISNIFYQSLLCPDNSTYVGPGHTISDNNKPGGYVNPMCKCKDDFTVFNGACLPLCDNGGQYTANGQCSTTACPTNSHDVNENSAEFWGHCACNNNYYWFPTLHACLNCPESSSYDENATSNTHNAIPYYNYKCVCSAGETNNPYFVVGNQRCARCPSDSSYNPNYTNIAQRCTCAESKTYCPGSNECISNTSTCLGLITLSTSEDEKER